MKGMRRNPFDLGLFHHQQEQDVVTQVSDNCFPLLFEIILINGVWSFSEVPEFILVYSFQVFWTL